MIAIVSDIHGNWPALDTVLATIDRMGIAEIICLGDTAGYYSGINECIGALRARDILHLMGNHDHYLVSGETCRRSVTAARCLDYQRRVITPDNLAWLGQSRLRHDAAGVSLVHGGWNDPIDEYLSEIREDYFARLEGRYFASGHTHVQGIWPMTGRTYANPGAVGQPRDGDPRAAFAVWSGGAFALHRVEYDIDATASAMARAGFEPHYYENLRHGTRIGGEISRVVMASPGAASVEEAGDHAGRSRNP